MWTTCPGMSPLDYTLAALLLPSGWSADRKLVSPLQPDKEILGYFDKEDQLGPQAAAAANSLRVFSISSDVTVHICVDDAKN